MEVIKIPLDVCRMRESRIFVCVFGREFSQREREREREIL